jgi:hypothetical protein
MVKLREGKRGGQYLTFSVDRYYDKAISERKQESNK